MKILVIDDEPIFQQYLVSIFEDILQMPVKAASSFQEAMRLPAEEMESVDIAFIDLQMPIVDGFQAGAQLKQAFPEIITVMMTAYPSVNKVIKALRDHQFDDFIIKEELEDVNELNQLNSTLRKAESLVAARRALRKEYQLNDALRSGYSTVHSGFVGQSAFYQATRELISRVAPSLSTILITGETGTGKELVAREIHAKSHRRSKPFIPINCSAIPSGLLESELFGHKKGAFTGAVGDRDGYFKLATGGTLFLDEIGDMPLELQSKLLRVLEEKQFLPVGSSNFRELISFDVRVISATNQNIDKKIKEGNFRRDLLYRLNTIVIPLSPLREHLEDIEPLIDHFLALKSEGKNIQGLTPIARQKLFHWHWPGNIRELKNVMERAILLCDRQEIDKRDLPESIQNVPVDPEKETRRKERYEQPTANRLHSNPVRQREFNKTANLDMENLWTLFQENDYRLWRFENEDQVIQEYQVYLEGAVYQTKGHSSKIWLKNAFSLDVPISFLDCMGGRLEKRLIRFQFLAEEIPPENRIATPDINTERIINQYVRKGLPDTYLFRLLYPTGNANDFSLFTPRRIVRGVLLRYLLENKPGASLKTLFQRTMSFLTVPEMVGRVDGLRYDGLEAVRAYLCSANQIFGGVSRTLKTEPEKITAEIEALFFKEKLV